MTQMTIIDVCTLTYPGQIDLGNIVFGQAETGPIFITKWTVPDVEQPTIQFLESLIPNLQIQFDLWYFVNIGRPQLKPYLDNVAQERQYDSAISCASYISSTVPQWKNEATAFVSWRDSVFNYMIDQITLMSNGERSVPTFEEFKNELPVITWP
jgi:hypothetical protein